MNQATTNFVETLKKNPNVLGIILFGSWARGNNRKDSDVDLVVIIKEGFKRAVEVHEGQVFEIIYTTESSAFEFWKNHLDEAYDLWSVAKILHDTDDIVSDSKDKMLAILNKGKKSIKEPQIGQLRFDAGDQLKYVRNINEKDRTTASMILNNKIFVLTELYFDLRQLWTPAPKQRLEKIRSLDPELHQLLVEFYDQKKEIDEKLLIAEKIIRIIFIAS